MPVWLRWSLAFTAPLNIVGAVLMSPLFPGFMVGQGFPVAPPLHLALLSQFVFIFGLGYAWMAWTNEHMEPTLHTLVMECVRLAPDARNRAAAAAANDDAIAAVRLLDDVLAQQRWMGGAEFGIADIPTACAVYRWTLFEFERPPFARVQSWLDAAMTRPGFRTHVLPREFHLRCITIGGETRNSRKIILVDFILDHPILQRADTRLLPRSATEISTNQRSHEAPSSREQRSGSHARPWAGPVRN